MIILTVHHGSVRFTLTDVFQIKMNLQQLSTIMITIKTKTYLLDIDYCP